MTDQEMYILLAGMLVVTFGPLLIYCLVAAVRKLITGLRLVKQRETGQYSALRTQMSCHIRKPKQ